MTTTAEMKRLTAEDGHIFDCWIRPADDAPIGGIVILQEIFGVTDQLKGVADRYAADGFDVAIPALFDRREPGTVVSFDNGAVGRDLMMSLKTDEVMMDIRAATNWLSARGRKVGAIGFCWGGGLAVRAAQKLDIAAAVAFYGTRLTSYLDDDLNAPVQMHFGSEDEHVPPEMRDAFMARFPQAEVHLYPAGHAFANDARPGLYSDKSTRTAHDRALSFLKSAMT